jgi:hypothetical protein
VPHRFCENSAWLIDEQTRDVDVNVDLAERNTIAARLNLNSRKIRWVGFGKFSDLLTRSQ